jgi:hypothetical protein
VAARERAGQKVEDLEDELSRVRRDRTRLVRPDCLLWAGVLVLIYFTAVGVALPGWVMSRGPRDLTPHIRWLYWFFASALGVLVAYIAGYLFRLTRRSGPAWREES